MTILNIGNIYPVCIRIITLIDLRFIVKYKILIKIIIHGTDGSFLGYDTWYIITNGGYEISNVFEPNTAKGFPRKKYSST